MGCKAYGLVCVPSPQTKFKLDKKPTEVSFILIHTIFTNSKFLNLKIHHKTLWRYLKFHFLFFLMD